MSIFQAVWEPIRTKLAGRRKDKSKQVTSLIEQFEYPKYGPGMMWERCRDLVEAEGTKVIMETPVARIRHAAKPHVVAEAEGSQTECGRPRGLVHALPAPAPGDGPAAARRGTRRRRRADVP